VLPRSGGVLDQPDREVRKLERILGAYGKYEDHQRKKKITQEKNRKKHSPTPGESLREELRGH